MFLVNCILDVVKISLMNLKEFVVFGIVSKFYCFLQFLSEDLFSYLLCFLTFRERIKPVLRRFGWCSISICILSKWLTLTRIFGCFLYLSSLRRGIDMGFSCLLSCDLRSFSSLWFLSFWSLFFFLFHFFLLFIFFCSLFLNFLFSFFCNLCCTGRI